MLCSRMIAWTWARKQPDYLAFDEKTLLYLPVYSNHCHQELSTLERSLLPETWI